jgi:hypothetical protein
MPLVAIDWLAGILFKLQRYSFAGQALIQQRCDVKEGTRCFRGAILLPINRFCIRVQLPYVCKKL